MPETNETPTQGATEETANTSERTFSQADLLKAKFAAVPGYKSDPHDNGGAHREPPKRDIPIVF